MSAGTFLGALMISAGAGGIGITAAFKLKKRLDSLSSFISALEFMKAEIAYGFCPLPVMLAELQSRKGVIGDFWKNVSCSWKPGSELYPAWETSLGMLTALREEDKSILLEAGRVLGRYDAERQTERLEFLKQRLLDTEKSARDDFIKNSKLCCVMGIAAGLAVTIMIL